MSQTDPQSGARAAPTSADTAASSPAEPAAGGPSVVVARPEPGLGRGLAPAPPLFFQVALGLGGVIVLGLLTRQLIARVKRARAAPVSRKRR